MTYLEKYNQVFMNIFNVGTTVLNDEFSFDKITEWDSIAHMSLIAELEDEFDIMLGTEDILNFGSYENGKLILKKNDIDI